MGKRSRKRRAEPAQAPAPQPRVSRSELRNAEARAQLEPLEPGERPLAVTIGAIATVLVGAANVIAYAAGETIHGKRPAALGIVLFTGLMLAMAWGLWNARYWAVLGLEALLGILILIFALVGLAAENVKSGVLAVAVIVAAGTLFWFLIKAMARIQMPQRPR